MVRLLKFITCGSVDDGKSTLIGNILYNSKLLYADQEEALILDSKVGSRGGAIDYSLLLDGLMAEREQGITIDVAYRYFTTNKRSFIVADTPGHEEYTRNMAVGASFAEVAILLLDVTKGVLVQTRRHARICSMVGIRHFVFAVNKMDLANYSEEKFNKIVNEVKELAKELELENDVVFPGHIKFEEILAFYKVADLFLCMSEHEGFCVPLVESMFFEVPILTYNSSAIKNTLGNSGIIVNKKDYFLIAELMNFVLSDKNVKKEIINNQNKRLEDFQLEKVEKQLLEFIRRIGG